MAGSKVRSKVKEYMTKSEQYVNSKSWDYQDNGDQLVVTVCPFCGNDNHKFYIGKENFLWDCKVCGVKGNEYQLKERLGDVIKGVDSQQDKAPKKTIMPDWEAAHKALLANDDVLNWLNDERGWSLEAIKELKIGLDSHWVDDAMRDCLLYPYFAGKMFTFAKWRTLPPAEKGFASTGGKETPLYNQNAITKDMDYLVIVEGEADAISVLSVGEPNVVGVPGAGMKKTAWDNMLNLPKKIYLLFDNDEAGKQGAKKFAERFGIERFHNVLIPEFDLLFPEGERTKGKDIGEWLQQGNSLEDFQELLKSGKPIDVEGVRGLEGSLEELIVRMEERGGNTMKYDSPWPSVNKRFKGAEDGHLTIISAPMKTGKSTAALNWLDYLVTTKNVSCFFECLEMTNTDLGKKWASYVTRTEDTPEKFTVETVRLAQSIAANREYDLLFGYPVITKLEAVLDRLRAVVRRYGVKVIVYDNLQALCDLIMSTGKTETSRDAFMSQITKRFKALAMELGIWFILIAQTKRLEDGAVANSNSLEGTGKAGNDCDSMLIMNRVKVADIRKTEDLKAMGGVIETDEAFSPEVYISSGLTRYASGGWATLIMEGALSMIRERYTTEEQDAFTRASNTVAGLHVTPAEETEVTV
jgi:hypothetical protein